MMMMMMMMNGLSLLTHGRTVGTLWGAGGGGGDWIPERPQMPPPRIGYIPPMMYCTLALVSTSREILLVRDEHLIFRILL